MTQAATQEIRTKFEQSRHETDEGAVRKLLDDGREASEFIQSFVVQGKLNERGNYGGCPQGEGRPSWLSQRDVGGWVPLSRHVVRW